MLALFRLLLLVCIISFIIWIGVGSLSWRSVVFLVLLWRWLINLVIYMNKFLECFWGNWSRGNRIIFRINVTLRMSISSSQLLLLSALVTASSSLHIRLRRLLPNQQIIGWLINLIKGSLLSLQRQRLLLLLLLLLFAVTTSLSSIRWLRSIFASASLYCSLLLLKLLVIISKDNIALESAILVLLLEVLLVFAHIFIISIIRILLSGCSSLRISWALIVFIWVEALTRMAALCRSPFIDVNWVHALACGQRNIVSVCLILVIIGSAWWLISIFTGLSCTCRWSFLRTVFIVAISIVVGVVVVSGLRFSGRRVLHGLILHLLRLNDLVTRSLVLNRRGFSVDRGTTSFSALSLKWEWGGSYFCDLERIWRWENFNWYKLTKDGYD